MKLAEPGTYNGPAVRFFTTAMIDGCSVYIEGPGDAPKVIHANAHGVPVNRVTDYQPFGAVLGFKDGNNWSFWLQKTAPSTTASAQPTRASR